MSRSPKPGDLCRIELDPERNPYLGSFSDEGHTYLAHRFLQGRFDPQVFQRFEQIGMCIPPEYVSDAYNEYRDLVYAHDPISSKVVLFYNEIWLFEDEELRIL